MDAEIKAVDTEIYVGQIDIGQIDTGHVESSQINSVTENSFEEEQTQTIYLPQDDKALPNIDVVVSHGDLAESIKVSEAEVSLALSEPVAIGLTDTEFERLKQQLVELPPEVRLEAMSGVVCEKCASIIYRPIL